MLDFLFPDIKVRKSEIYRVQGSRDQRREYFHLLNIPQRTFSYTDSCICISGQYAAAFEKVIKYAADIAELSEAFSAEMSLFMGKCNLFSHNG